MHRRFRDPNPEEIEALTLEGMREAVMAQLHPSNIEINIVGDIAGADVDDVVLKYLGTVSPREPAEPLTVRPPVILYPPAHLRRQAWHLKVRPECAQLRNAFCKPCYHARLQDMIYASPTIEKGQQGCICSSSRQAGCPACCKCGLVGGQRTFNALPVMSITPCSAHREGCLEACIACWPQKE